MTNNQWCPLLRDTLFPTWLVHKFWPGQSVEASYYDCESTTSTVWCWRGLIPLEPIAHRFYSKLSHTDFKCLAVEHSHCGQTPRWHRVAVRQKRGLPWTREKKCIETIGVFRGLGSNPPWIRFRCKNIKKNQCRENSNAITKTLYLLCLSF